MFFLFADAVSAGCLRSSDAMPLACRRRPSELDGNVNHSSNGLRLDVARLIYVL